jgi:hypothetical protein
MYKNYEKRVKDFITEMTNPLSQIVINDITEKVNNCRQELMNERKMQKPFIFKGYISEQDRINDTVKNHKLLFNLPDYPEIKKNRSTSQDNDNSSVSPRINFHINENEKNKTIADSPVKAANSNLSLDNSTIKDKKDSLKYSYKRRMSTTEKNQIKALIKKDSILQPQMRFTARTDLERVYDVLNGDYIKHNEREIIERQLKHINLYNYRKPKELLKGEKFDSSFNDDDAEHKIKNDKSPLKDIKKNKSIKNIYGPSNIYFEIRNNDRKAWARKDNLNTEARGLLSSYHFKTHFKATEEIAEYKNNKNSNLKDSCFLLPHLLPKNHRYQNLNTDLNLNNNSYINKTMKTKKPFDYSKIEDTRKIFNFDEEHQKDEINEKKEEGGYNGVNNPILKDNKYNIDPHSLKVLSKLAFKNSLNENEELNVNENNDANVGNTFKDNDYSNKNKNDDINAINLNQIAKKILNECNVYTQKSKFNNSSHKTKGGKTMITKGMTIEEFENKFNLKEL